MPQGRPSISSTRRVYTWAPTRQSRTAGAGWARSWASFPGLGVGALYGLVRPALGGVSTPRASGDATMVVLGVTDPGQWGANAWLSDLIPHLAYGLITTADYAAFVRDGGRHF